MKKVARLGLAALVACAFMFWAGSALAINGACASCHTMHNSQQGALVDTNGPNAKLLTSDCVGCHTGANAGTDAGLTTNPNVHDTAAPVNELAGGSFFHTIAGGSASIKGHNVGILTNVTAGPAGDPYGWDTTENGTWAGNLTCAGVAGCHGDRSVTGNDPAMSGTHHANTAGLTDGTSLGASFRFLNGIAGYEDDDYQIDLTLDHNVYKGVSQNLESAADTTTISYLCSSCHGNFHGEGNGDIDAAGSWVRHPTDIALPASGEYASYNAGGGYSVDAPLASTAPSAAAAAKFATWAPATDGNIVNCLSCHVAHASANDYALRWDYSAVSAGSGAGNVACFICHTAKD